MYRAHHIPSIILRENTVVKRHSHIVTLCYKRHRHNVIHNVQFGFIETARRHEKNS